MRAATLIATAMAATAGAMTMPLHVAAAPGQPLDVVVVDAEAPDVVFDVVVPPAVSATPLTAAAVTVDGAPVDELAPVDPKNIAVSLVIDDRPTISGAVVEAQQGATVELGVNLADGTQLALYTASGLRSQLTVDREAAIARVAGVTAGAPDVAPLPDIILDAVDELSRSPLTDRHVVVLLGAPLTIDDEQLESLSTAVGDAGVRLHVVAPSGAGRLAEVSAATSGLAPSTTEFLGAMDRVTRGVRDRSRVSATVDDPGAHTIALEAQGNRYTASLEVVAAPVAAPAPTTTATPTTTQVPATTAAAAATTSPTTAAAAAPVATAADAPATSAAPASSDADGDGSGIAGALVAIVIAGVVAAGIIGLVLRSRRRRTPVPTVPQREQRPPPPVPSAPQPVARSAEPPPPPPPAQVPAPMVMAPVVIEAEPEAAPQPEPEPAVVAELPPEPPTEPELVPEPEPAVVADEAVWRRPASAVNRPRVRPNRGRDHTKRPVPDAPVVAGPAETPSGRTRRGRTVQPPLKRRHGDGAQAEWLVVGRLRMSTETGEVLSGKRQVDLAPGERNVLQLLMTSNGEALTISTVLEAGGLDPTLGRRAAEALVAQVERQAGTRLHRQLSD